VISVTPEQALTALTALARRAGIDVRIEAFRLDLAGKGGLCRAFGRPVVLVDARLGTVEQAGVLGLALGRADLGAVEVPRELWSWLRTGHGPLRPILRPKPLARVRRLRLVAQNDDER
jgi:hypothetical protein